MSTFTLENEYVAVNCGHNDGGCGVEFAMTRDFYRMTKREGRYWYCPNGHRRVWGGKTDSQKLKEAEARETALRDQLAAAVHDAETTRQTLLRDRARFAAGVCPCCNRSFENVRRHMATQHPEYDVTRVARHAVTFKCSCGRAFESLRGLRTHQGHQRRTSGPYRWDKPNQAKWAAHLTEVGAR